MAKSEKVKVVCGYDNDMTEGATVCLWGVVFTCDGKKYTAELKAEDAKPMIEAGRVTKV